MDSIDQQKKKYCWTEHTLKSKYKQTNQNHVSTHGVDVVAFVHTTYNGWKEIRMLNVYQFWIEH